ncbi:cyclin-A2-1 [Dioscorea cayenensis subsp. rotundata]|uniref:Cyclin-A2-1 n=1 Tax=Dioscorea cayennensis subsp. rotundata TaxID=55577 RepID=A0AB40AR19_DIOCR|nr:cyclin-A2-1 [Dioscorea cayenensis subsp. rotundata]
MVGKENKMIGGYGAPTVRITRSRAAACQANGGVLHLNPPLAKPEMKRTQRENSKRTLMEENSHAACLTANCQPKKRAALKDVQNIRHNNLPKDCIDAPKMQPRVLQRVKLGSAKAKSCLVVKNSKLCLIDKDTNNKMADRQQEAELMGSKENNDLVKLEEKSLAAENVDSIKDVESTCGPALFDEHSCGAGPQFLGRLKDVESKLYADCVGLPCSDIMDIDCDHANPQMCSLYAPDIYANLHTAELIRRPCSDFMERLQRDITHGMRGILIDWLVEVSDEYRLVPDTLYLTVYLIDRFLSKHYIERQRLQLLGITCMLIASKYEEICAPRVEEFCFITDNTYTKGEVLKMESEVLNYQGFHLSVPTIKTFLRRFLRAAQTSSEVPTPALGFLANYLAELTLVDYDFLKYLPSKIAASAVFLTRWTLDQSEHPWNPTLEHYTSYKASDLTPVVLAMQDLQTNLRNCPLNSVREKYKQQKFENVATLTSPKLPHSLFC